MNTWRHTVDRSRVRAPGRVLATAILTLGLAMGLVPFTFGGRVLAHQVVAAQESDLGEPVQGEVMTVDRGNDTLTVVVHFPGTPDSLALPLVEVVDPTTGISDIHVADVEPLDITPTVMLVVDASGSMAGTRLADAKVAAVQCIDRLPSYVSVGLVPYADRPAEIVAPSTDHRVARSSIIAIQAAGETATFDAVIGATEVLSAPALDAIEERASRFVIVLTDGEDTASQASVDDAIEALSVSGFRLYALGLEPLADLQQESTLELLTEQAAGVLVTGTAHDLGAICETIATRIESRYRLSVDLVAPPGPFDLRLRFADMVIVATVPAAPADLAPPTTDPEPAAKPAPEPSGLETTGLETTDLEPTEPAAGAIPADGASVGTSGTDGTGETDGASGIDGSVGAGGARGPGPGSPDASPNPAHGAEPVKGPPSGWIQSARLWFGASLIAGGSLLVALTLVSQRAKALSIPVRRETSPQPVARMSLFADRLLERRSLKTVIDRRLEVAALSLRAGEFVVFTGLGAVLPALGLAMLGLGKPAAAVVAGVPVVIWTWTKRKANKRVNDFQLQLGNTLAIVSGSLRAGQGIAQALMVAADKAPSPNAEEFQRVVTEMRIGRDLVSALEDMADRMGSEDTRWVVEAIGLNRQLGGNLASALDNVAGTIAARAEIRSQVRVLSAEGRLTAIILLSLPVAVAMILQVINPGYLLPLFTDRVGNVVLAIAVGLMAIGGMWVNRLVQVEY